MNVIAYRSIREFYEKHPSTKQGLRTWYTILKSQVWKKPQDAVTTFGAKRVDILKNNRLCIDVKGNHIRVILSMHYEKNTAFIKWLGWHKDYDKLGNNVHTIHEIKRRK
ncbi:MAG: type II toxin-antitoxin system HigB family toxin [Bacteroidetes bacterium]|nr:MAG: type II toxin-antitoxin system HigB family toxin [Bacteroidota bacterium]